MQRKSILILFTFLQGTIASMFNAYSKLGKLYVFDIQRTYREVYDHARRVLHAKGIDISIESKTNNSDLFNIMSNDMNSCDEDDGDDTQRKMEKEVAERISEAITCRICMDREINTSFTPCGHITTCSTCAEK